MINRVNPNENLPLREGVFRPSPSFSDWTLDMMLSTGSYTYAPLTSDRCSVRMLPRFFNELTSSAAFGESSHGS